MAATTSSHLEGINYVLDADGQKKAVIIDIDLYASYLEDLLDVISAEQARKDPYRISLSDLRKELGKEGKLK